MQYCAGKARRKRWNPPRNPAGSDRRLMRHLPCRAGASSGLQPRPSSTRTAIGNNGSDCNDTLLLMLALLKRLDCPVHVDLGGVCSHSLHRHVQREVVAASSQVDASIAPLSGQACRLAQGSYHPGWQGSRTYTASPFSEAPRCVPKGQGRSRAKRCGVGRVVEYSSECIRRG